ncbi:hypothetical protein BDB00DRAFT_784913 [Zychaea mexicana]|uniref:uncharacterized protein n=1 Tax=Zychaea mexicana TaxID=64656 RepID=UPI0022FE158A|nr:uncharacterized protein BDB00DRAFT_784913 [Zychaea mexicana]KAI9497172.1 hypothetical protein BDB00DRAFT_784913 [Zychaea mexicana]
MSRDHGTKILRGTVLKTSICASTRINGSDDSSIKKQNNKNNPDSNDNTTAVTGSHIHQVQVHLEEEEIGKSKQDGSFRRWLVELKASICAPQTSAIPLSRIQIRADQRVYNAVNMHKNFLHGHCASFIVFLSPLGSDVWSKNHA